MKQLTKRLKDNRITNPVVIFKKWQRSFAVIGLLLISLSNLIAQDYPDLIITDLKWENITSFSGNADSIVVGDTIVFMAMVKNQGEFASPEGIKHGVAFKVKGAGIGWTDTCVTSLAAGDSVLLPIIKGGEFGNGKWLAKAPGEYDLFAYVDDACGGACGENRPECKRICETNEDNNTLTENFTIFGETPVIPKMPDLAIINLEFVDANGDKLMPASGDDVFFKATIANIGDKMAVSSNGEIRTTFLINDTESGSRISRTIGAQIFDSLSPGETIMVTGNFGEGTNKGTVAGSWVAKTGDTLILAQIDRENKVEEANENNNIFYRMLYTDVDVDTLKPDLICTDILFDPPSPVIIGDTITLSAVIKNIGLKGVVSNSDSRVKFRHNGALISRTYSDQAINDTLAPDSSVIVSGNIQSNGPDGKWIPAEPGEYIIQAETDAQANVAEDIETNNNFFKRLVVYDLSDLIITDIGWAEEIDTVEAFVPVHLTAAVKNKSGAPLMVGDTLFTRWRALDSYIGFDTLVLEESVEPDSSVLVTMMNEWLPASGDIEVQAEANYNGSINEKYLDNNLYLETITVKKYSGPLPDLIVTDIQFDPPEPVDGDTISLSAVVENVGEGATFEGLEHRVYFHVDGTQVGWTVGDNIFKGSLEPYGTITLVQNYVFQGRHFVGQADKTYTVMAYVDKTEKIDEADENNNTYEEDITVAAKPGFDLVVSSVTANPASPVIDDNVTFSAVIENMGDISTADGETITVVFSVGETELESMEVTESLAAGTSITVNGTAEWTAVEGETQINVSVEISGETTESDLENNSNSITLNIIPDYIDMIGMKHLRFFPNPVNNELNIQATSEFNGSIQVNICNLHGKILMSKELTFTHANQTARLVLSDLQNGMYILQFKNDSWVSNARIHVVK